MNAVYNYIKIKFFIFEFQKAIFIPNLLIYLKNYKIQYYIKLSKHWCKYAKALYLCLKTKMIIKTGDKKRN